MPDPNARADHSAALFLGGLENNFPDPGEPNNPEGKPQSPHYKELARDLHREHFPELYPVDPDPEFPIDQELLSPEDFHWLGAFRPPADSAFAWSKGAAAFVPGSNGERILLCCEDGGKRIAEISLAPFRTGGFSDLARATIVTPPKVVGSWDGIRDVEILEGIVYGHSASHYEYTRAPKHFAAPLPLGSPAKGQWYVGQNPPIPHINTNEYLFQIDPAWASAHVPEKVLACGRHREGQAASGPAIIAFKPNPNAPAGAVLEAIPLLLYGDVSDPARWMNGHFKADDWLGAAWIRVGDKSAVIVIGEKGYGQHWYGWEYRDSENKLTRVVAGSGQCSQFPNDGIPCKSCADDPAWCEARGLEGGNRGYCADGYDMVGLLFSTKDLGRVAKGEIESWEPQPYARVDLTPYLCRARESAWYYPGRKIQMGGVAYDPGTRTLLFTERYGASGQNVIHGMRIGS